jgi:tetratricopeptide (TPR) repeat protein
MYFRRILFVCFVLVIAGCSTTNTKHKQEIFASVSKADRAYTQSQWFEAEKGYQYVISRVPKDHYAWFRLGNTQLHQGRIESAIHTFKKAIERNNKHPKTHYNLSIAYLLNALHSLQNSEKSMRENDPGIRIVQEKIEQLLNMIGEPIENTESPARHQSASDAAFQNESFTKPKKYYLRKSTR